MNLGELTVHIRADLRQLSRGLTRAQRKIKTFGARVKTQMRQIGQSMTVMGRRMAFIGAAIAGVVIGMVKKWGDFESAMRKATAATAITETEFKDLTQLVERLAVEVNKSAVEAAEGIKFLGFAGLTAAEQMEAFPPLLKLAKAGMADMGQVTEKTLGLMGAYQIEFKRTAEVTDFLAKLWGSSQQTLTQLAEAMSFTAASAADSSVSIEELGALTAVLAEAGIKGSRAGTTLRRTIINLKAPTSSMQSELDKLGVAVFDATGKLKPYMQSLREIFDAVKDGTEQQKNMAFRILFGTRAIEGQTVIFRKGSKVIDDYILSLKDAQGTVDEMVAKQMKAFNEQIGVTSRLFGELFRSIGATLVPALRDLNENIKVIIGIIKDWIKAHPDLVKAIVGTTLAIGALTAALGTLAFAIGPVLFLMGSLSTAIGATVAVIVGLGIGIGVVAKRFIDAEIAERKFVVENKKVISTLGKAKKAFDEWAEAMKAAGNEAEIAGRKARMRVLQEAIADLEARQAKIAGRIAELNFFEKIIIGPKAKELQQGLQIQIDIITKLMGNLAVEMKTDVKEINKAMDDLKPPEVTGLWEDFKNQMNKLAEEIKGGFPKTLQEAAQGITNAFEDAFVDTITKAQSFKETLNNLLKAIQEELLRAFFKKFIAGQIFTALGGVSETTAVETLAKGGVVKPVYAASGTLARGTDTVPAMLTPGELVVPKPITKWIGKQFGKAGISPEGGAGGGGSNVNIIIKAIDTKDVSRFFKDNSKLLASTVQGSLKGNHPLRKSIAGRQEI